VRPPHGARGVDRILFVPRRLTAVLLAFVAATGVSACGGSDKVSDMIPKETPELVPAGEGSGTLTAATSADATTDTTSTTDTTDTTTDATTAAPTTSGTAPAPAATAAPQDTGGTAAPQTGGTTGSTTEAGGFSDFCTQNPGACDN